MSGYLYSDTINFLLFFFPFLFLNFGLEPSSLCHLFLGVSLLFLWLKSGMLISICSISCNMGGQHCGQSRK
jgi:hypothetical protein